MYINWFIPITNEVFMIYYTDRHRYFTIVILAFCIVMEISKSASIIDKFVFTTKTPDSDGLGTLCITLSWNESYYQCTFNPATASDYICDNTTWLTGYITPDLYIPYHFKLEYNASDVAVRFDSFTITDNNGDTYTINDFCIR